MGTGAVDALLHGALLMGNVMRNLYSAGAIGTVALAIVGGMEPCWGSGASDMRALKAIHIESGSFVTVTGVTSFANPDSCGNANTIVILESNSRYKEMLSTAMLAYSTGDRVAAWLTGCANTPWGYTLPIAASISVNK
jgi:hypothetical protein